MPGIEAVQRRSGVNKDLIADVFKAITGFVEEGDKVTIRGFGTFKPGLKEEGTITSPVLKNTGGSAVIKARRVLKFHMADSLKKAWIFDSPKEYTAAVKAAAAKAAVKDDEDEAKPAPKATAGKGAKSDGAKPAKGDAKADAGKAASEPAADAKAAPAPEKKGRSKK